MSPPPVFIMNMHYTGMGIARSLHGRSARLYGLSSHKDAPGRRCGFIDKLYDVPDGRDEPDALCDKLLEIRNNHSRNPVIFPTRDLDVLFLHQYRKQLIPYFHIPQPDGDVIPRILDKYELAVVARELGIDVPETIVCSSIEEIENAGELLRFPVVAKPRFAYQWRRQGVWEKVGARKAVPIESVGQLREEYHRVSDVEKELLVQENIQGTDSDIVVFCCYVNIDGQLKGCFTARKLRQNPPLFGTGCVVEAVHIPEIIEPSLGILKKFNYSGIAEIEYKYDGNSKKYYLIEINPRLWDQHELGLSVGINLSEIAYREITGCDTRPVAPTYGAKPIKWVAERELLFLEMGTLFKEIVRDGDINGIIRIKKCFSAVMRHIRDMAKLLEGRRTLAVCRLVDPVPGIMLCISVVSELARVSIKKSREYLFSKRGDS